jgi:uncharacterized protein YndB with AHSA1/START domain
VSAKRPSIAAAAERELVITRTFDAPRALVFAAWTDPLHAREWWGPVNYPARHIEMDVRPGGAWRMCLRSTEGKPELWQGGVFREVVAPERLAFTFAWEEQGERGLETLVTVTFADEGGKTRMTFRQVPFQSIEERDGHQWGWNSTFDRLDGVLMEARGLGEADHAIARRQS